MRKLFAGLLTVGLMLGASSALQAQVSIAPEFAYGDDVDFGVGASVAFPLSAVHENLELAGRFNLFFPDGFDYWEINGDARFHFPLPDNDQLLPYALGGIAFGNFSFDNAFGDASTTEAGLRLGGGVKFPMASLTPFAELALGLGDVPDFALRGGVSLMLGS